MSASGYPDSTNTGVPSGTVLTASAGMTINTAGAVVSGLNITGMVDIAANNVTLENCSISADAYAQIVVEAGLSGVVIKNCTVYGGGINGVNNAGSLGVYIKGGGVTVEGCNISGAANGISLLGGPALIENNYIHDLGAASGTNHYNGIQFNGTNAKSGLIDIEHNTIVNQNNQTDAVMIDNYFGPVNNVTVNNNILVGGDYTVYVDGHFNSDAISNVAITNNHLGTGIYGYTDFSSASPTFTGNVDDGATLLQLLNQPGGVQSTSITKISASPTSGDFGVGKVVTFTVAASAAVTVAGGSPTLSLNDGGVATYLSGSGSSALTFTYKVAAAQNTSSLTATAINLNGSTIKDSSGNSANLSLTGLSQSGPQIDTSAPSAPVIASDSVSGNTVTLKGTAEANSTIHVYDGSTLLSGTAQTNSSGAWTFTTGALAPGAHAFTATATDLAGNTSAISDILDPVIGSTTVISSVKDSASTGDFAAGTKLTMTVNFSQAVNVAGGSPTLALNDGGTATYVSGSGGSTLTFSYTVGAGQNTSSLAATGINLNGATIKDSSGGAASLTLSGLPQIGPQIDTSAPTVKSITDVQLAPHRRIVTVTFSEPVQNFGIGDILLPNNRETIGTISGSGTTWTVNVGHVPTKQFGVFQIASSGTGASYWNDAAGNGGVGASATLMPAGAAGSPINLALSGLVNGAQSPLNVTISGVPDGWTLSQGKDIGNGEWLVHTSDLSALTITSPESSVGAAKLSVSATWTNTDGSVGHASVADNVEAYASGAPIFAWSGDDHLTGSSAADAFVFAGQIGADTINSFDAKKDTIDLVGEAGFKSFADVQAHLSSDSAGNAMITVATGQTITLLGVNAATLSASNFAFNATPATTNAGDMQIANGATLPLSGTIDNSGSIALASNGEASRLEVVGSGLVLNGGGKVLLSNNANNVIYGASDATTLTNADNTVAGAGMIGAGSMTLVNAGVIDGNEAAGLTIDTGSNAVVNSGLLEATAGGSVTVDSALDNSGRLAANGGALRLMGDVSGDGSAVIGNASSIEFGAASSQNVRFGQGGAESLVLDHSSAFTGSVSGFRSGDLVDLADINFAHATLGYAENKAHTGGTLTASDGVHTASLTLFGQYSASGFHSAADSSGGSILTYLPSANDPAHHNFLARTGA